MTGKAAKEAGKVGLTTVIAAAVDLRDPEMDALGPVWEVDVGGHIWTKQHNRRAFPFRDPRITE